MISIYNLLIARAGWKHHILNAPWVIVFLKLLNCDLFMDFTKWLVPWPMPLGGSHHERKEWAGSVGLATLCWSCFTQDTTLSTPTKGVSLYLQATLLTRSGVGVPENKVVGMIWSDWLVIALCPSITLFPLKFVFPKHFSLTGRRESS